jgi:hypothetical protein
VFHFGTRVCADLVHEGAPTWYSNRLLESLYVGEQVPAWSNNRLKSLVQARKRYVVDPALAAAATRMTPDAVLRDVDMPMCPLWGWTRRK